MTRLQIDQSIGSAGWRRIMHLVFLLPAIPDLIFNLTGAAGSFFPKAYGISPDQNSNIHQQPRYAGSHTANKIHSGQFYNIDDEVRDSNTETSKQSKDKRRRAIEIIRSVRTSFGGKLIEKKNLRKIFFSKRKPQSSLQETTRLVGGANIEIEVEEDPQQHYSSVSNPPSTNSPHTIERSKSFLESLFPSKFFFFPGDSEVFRKNFQQTLAIVHKISSQAGPSIMTVLSLLGNFGTKDEISLVTLYLLALLGASCGFHLFLHFITLGYAMGVTLPLVVALNFYQKQYELPLPTVLHSLITILWGIRLFTFLTIREYATWPALHQKVVEVQAKMNIPFASKILCWFLYSFFYVALVAPCWSRLLQNSSLSSWGVFGYVGLSLQVLGLSLETVADLQKNSFKSRNRLSWCNVGVWNYSTHPNYLGEGLFWWGTYLAHGFHSLVPSVLATVGLVFILYVLKGSAKSLSSKQKEKYGQEVDFYQFQRTHNVFGPKQLWSRQRVVETASLSTEASIHNHDNTTSLSSDGSI